MSNGISLTDKCITMHGSNSRIYIKILARLRLEITELIAPSALRSISRCSHGHHFQKKSSDGLPLKYLRNESRPPPEDVSIAESPTELQEPRFNETGFLSQIRHTSSKTVNTHRHWSRLVQRKFHISHNGAARPRSELSVDGRACLLLKSPQIT